MRQQWELRLEAARYAVRLAQRRYEQVDPENRLVARTLEKEWEACLQEQQTLEIDWIVSKNSPRLQLDETQRQRLLSLVTDLPQVWRAETTSSTERKELLRLMVADVTLTRQKTRSRYSSVGIPMRWIPSLWTFPLRGAMPAACTDH